MPQPSILYDTLLILFQPAPWRDVHHLSALCWMVAGLLTSSWIALDEWAPGVAVPGRATLCCPGHDAAVERGLRGAGRVGLARAHRAGGLEGAAVPECQRGVRELPGRPPC